jgi:hypothetical protein
MFAKQMLWAVMALLCLATVLASPVPNDSSSNSSESDEAKTETVVKATVTTAPVAAVTEAPLQQVPIEVQESTTEQVEISSPAASQNEVRKFKQFGRYV